MASLKDLRSRIASVQSTKRITSAMKMVAAAKLKKAEETASSARPYAASMEGMLTTLAKNVQSSSLPLLTGTGKNDTHLIVLITSDRGLCGGFNGSLVREVRRMVKKLDNDGKQAKLLIIGRKGGSALRRDMRDKILHVYEEISKPLPSYNGALEVANKITEEFENGGFDCCTLVYNKFISALTQEVTPLQLIPFGNPDSANDNDAGDENTDGESQAASYEFEPEEESILAQLLPRNLSVQIFRGMLESFASEQGARMTAMDNATRNAGEMIDKLSITYNRSRQAQITNELIEIISGAEAL
jgi:F-type H+-transporting ATPase subunit gamma